MVINIPFRGCKDRYYLLYRNDIQQKKSYLCTALSFKLWIRSLTCLLHFHKKINHKSSSALYLLCLQLIQNFVPGTCARRFRYVGSSVYVPEPAGTRTWDEALHKACKHSTWYLSALSISPAKKRYLLPKGWIRMHYTPIKEHARHRMQESIIRQEVFE